MAVEVEVELQVAIRSEADVVTARKKGRELAQQVGFAGTDLALIATAISEVARNIIEYAKEGEIRLCIIHQGNTRGISVEARDDGPGIADVTQAMQNGFTTGKGLGLGLPGARRLMDEFEIDSRTGQGTAVKMRKWIRSHG